MTKDATMLDIIAAEAASLLGVTTSEVEEKFEALLAEQAAGGRRAAITAQVNTEGSSTPLSKAARQAQQTHAKLHREAEEVAKLMAVKIVALEGAARRRDATAKAVEAARIERVERLDTGVHEASRSHFARLFDHGVTPHNLVQHGSENVAVLADLMRWKARDPRYLDPDNPWRAVLPVFAGRLIKIPDTGSRPALSVPGTPVAPVRPSDPRHYRFDRMVTWVYPPVPGSEDWVLYEEAKEELAESGLWSWGLRDALLRQGRDVTLDVMLAGLEAEKSPTFGLPFTVFVEAARSGGVRAGWSSYYEATLRARFDLLRKQRG